jgi:hypothetical protein
MALLRGEIFFLEIGIVILGKKRKFYADQKWKHTFVLKCFPKMLHLNYLF